MFAFFRATRLIPCHVSDEQECMIRPGFDRSVIASVTVRNESIADSPDFCIRFEGAFRHLVTETPYLSLPCGKLGSRSDISRSEFHRHGKKHSTDKSEEIEMSRRPKLAIPVRRNVKMTGVIRTPVRIPLDRSSIA